MPYLEVLDTTLRDGAQGEGISFSLDDKIKIAQALDSLGIPFIEGGNPAANPKDELFFAAYQKAPFLSNAKLCAFGSTIRAGAVPDTDTGLQALLASGAQVISLFGKCSMLHVSQVLRCSPDENLRMIEESVGFLTQAGRQVFFDGEHFFDGFKHDEAYALACLHAAAKGGAVRLVLCDTNGGSLPELITRAVKSVCDTFKVPVGIHCHNDCGLAVANTVLGVQAGATHVQGTIGGIGERCGNANLCTLMPLLQLKMDIPCIPEAKMQTITSTARYIAEIMNMSPAEQAPFVGHTAFAHKGGMHIDGVMKNNATFEHFSPEAVGNHRRFLLSEQTGRTGILARLAPIAPDVERDSPEMQLLINKLKEKEFRGYAYENADASFALLALDILGRRNRFFEVKDFHVLSGLPKNAQDRNNSAQAYIKIAVNGQEEINAAEGDGPVNALDNALRKALAVFYPCIEKMRLKDFKVRVLDSGGTASTVRVSIESTDGKRLWSTVGVSSNIIQACMKALTDSINFLLMYYQGE